MEATLSLLHPMFQQRQVIHHMHRSAHTREYDASNYSLCIGLLPLICASDLTTA
jgi:hypothetical protein